MAFSLLLATVSCVCVCACCLVLALGTGKLRWLDQVKGEGGFQGPRVSVIIPACNEEVGIERALRSVLAQSYANMEIIVVNDRSVDGTAGVLKGLKEMYPQLIIKEITDLPAGWMGKSHALATGAELAGGEYLLFTDADVVMEATTISRAVRWMLDRRLDHLTLTFHNMTGGWLLNCLILNLALGLLLLFRPWAVSHPNSRTFMGIGAFNMVRRSAYRAVGGHGPIRMHPIDDLMLGKILKENGFAQDCLVGNSFLAVPWYSSVTAMIAGLQKNMFAFVHYRVSLVLTSLAVLLVVEILPLWAIMFSRGSVQLLWILTLLVKLVFFFFTLRRQGLPGWYFPGAVVAPYIVMYIIVTSTNTVLRNGGIVWRGHHYPLEELKKSRPLFL